MEQKGLRADLPPPEQLSTHEEGTAEGAEAVQSVPMSPEEQREQAWLAALDRSLRRRSTADLRNRAELFLGKFEKVR